MQTTLVGRVADPVWVAAPSTASTALYGKLVRVHFRQQEDFRRLQKGEMELEGYEWADNN